MGVWQKVRKRKDGTAVKHWAYKFKHQRRQYKGEGYPSRSAAIRAEAAKRAEVEAPQQKQIPGVSVLELGTEYLNDCRRQGLQHNTVRQKGFVIHSFLDFMGDDPPASAITEKLGKNFLDSRLAQDPPAPHKTINRYLRDMRAFYNWAMDPSINQVAHNPFTGIKSYPEDITPPYVPPPADVAKVREIARGIESDIIETIYYTAGRLGEIVKYRHDTGTHPITWDDINFDQHRIRLYTRKRGGKGLQVDEMYIGNHLLRILKRRWHKRDKASPYVFEMPQFQARYMMARICKAAAVRMFTVHALRHYALSILDDKGKATLRELQDFARHQRGSTTERYRHNISTKQRTAQVLEEASG